MNHLNRYTATLQQLPEYTTESDLVPLLRKLRAPPLYWHIPESKSSGKSYSHAYVHFRTQADLNAALSCPIKLQGQLLIWTKSTTVMCPGCGTLTNTHASICYLTRRRTATRAPPQNTNTQNKNEQ